MKKERVKFLLSLAIGLALLYLTLRYIDLGRTLAAIGRARTDKLGWALALLVAAYLLRGRRWTIWEPGLSWWESFKIILVGFMGNNVLPARLGEVLRAHLASRLADNGQGRTATLASVAIERILDGFVIALFGALGLLLVPLGARLSLALALVCALFLVLTALLVAGNRAHLSLKALIDRLQRRFPGRLGALGAEKTCYFLDGLQQVRHPATLASALLMTAVIWLIELASYALIASAVFPGTGQAVPLLFLAVVNFASLFPFTVGGIGSIEGAASAFLIDAGLPLDQSLAMVLIQHGFQFLFTTLAGGLFYFTGRYYRLEFSGRGELAVQAVLAAPEADADRLVLQETRTRMDRLSQDLGIARKKARDIELSIVIPAYNERSRLPQTVLETIKWCKEECADYEIIIVDDGSSDKTLEIALLFAEYQDNVSAIANPHLGKGAAVRSGMLNAAGRQVLFMDADGATPLDQIPRLRGKLEEGYPIAIGSRIVRDRTETAVVTPWHRKLIGRLFALLVGIFGIKGIGDTQCGFKLFRHEVVKELFSRQKLNGFAFDVEILFLAHRLSLPVCEVPVNWHNQEGSKVNLALDGMKMLRDLLKLKFIHKGL